MGPTEILKLEIEREERGEIMMEFQKLAESAGEIPCQGSLLDRLRLKLEFIGSFIIGLFLGILSLFILYMVIHIMK